MSSPPSKARKRKPWTSLTARFAAGWTWTKATTSKLYHKSVEECIETLKGAPQEKPKIILRRDCYAIAAKCSIHVLPTLTVIVLAYINIRGLFIGRDLQGRTEEWAQDLDRLCLQVVAKLFELLVVASLGVILVDGIRDKLLFGTEGVPLGLALANIRFSDVSYLFTHDFRAGLSGFKTVRTRILFALLIVACVVVGLLVGPASALLVIPQYYTAWPAGGASFWLHDGLFPPTLDVSDVLATACGNLSASDSVIQVPDYNTIQCPWAGYDLLSAEFMQRILGLDYDVVYSAGTFRQSLYYQWDFRPIGYSVHSARVWVFSTNIVIGSFARYISQWCWTQALWLARETQAGRYLASLKDRSSFGTLATIKSKMPLVRAQCFLVDEWPVLLDTGGLASLPTEMQRMPFPLIFDYAGLQDYAVFIPVNLTNLTTSSATWIAVPEQPSPTSYGSMSSDYPSALLFLRQPGLGFSDSDVTCSVKAHWANGKNIAGAIALNGVESIDSRPQLEAAVWAAIEDWGGTNHGDYPQPPRPGEPRPWESVTLTPAWLNLLTPSLVPEATDVQTTLSALLKPYIEASNLPSLYGQYQNEHEFRMFVKLGQVVAGFVANGMTRTGWNENDVQSLDSNGASNVYFDNPGEDVPGWHWDAGGDGDRSYSQLIKGTASLTPNIRRGPGTTYNLDVTVEGYGFKAAGTAYWLALAVLFAYISLVIAHVVYTIHGRRVSKAWATVTDFVVLSQVSDPPEDAALKDCSSGVKTHAVLGTQLRIRAVKARGTGKEELQLIVDRKGKSALGKVVEFERAYGAIP